MWLAVATAWGAILKDPSTGVDETTILKAPVLNTATWRIIRQHVTREVGDAVEGHSQSTNFSPS